MRFTIITVAFNSEKTIGKTMESVLNQSYTDVEYLIIDGASQDRTVDTAEHYRNALEEKGIALRIISEPDHGIYDAMNKGIRETRGDVIGILNTGDYYEPKALKIAADTFEKESCDLLFANIRLHKENGISYLKKARLRRFQTSRDWNHPTTFVKAQLYKKYPFPGLGIHDDYGFYLKMRKLGKKIVVVDEVLANFMMGGASNHKSFGEAVRRIRDRYRYCYRINGYSRWYMVECVVIEGAKMLIG